MVITEIILMSLKKENKPYNEKNKFGNDITNLSKTPVNVYL